MYGDLAGADHLVCHIISKSRDGDVVNAEGQCLRPDESALSVNRLEAFVGDKRFQLDEVRRLCRLKVRKSGRLAELKIGAVRKKELKKCVEFRILHDQLDAVVSPGVVAFPDQRPIQITLLYGILLGPKPDSNSTILRVTTPFGKFDAHCSCKAKQKAQFESGRIRRFVSRT